MNALPDRLLVVSDRHQSVRPLPEQMALALAGGARWVWLRDRDLPEPERRALAELLRAGTARHGASLTIGGDVALALAVGADGVHLRAATEVAQARARLGAAALIGVSCHGLADVPAAAAAGADYVTLSPVFASASKPGYGPALGTALLREAGRCGPPVVALGGVTSATAPDCFAAGAAAVAVMGPLARSADPAALVRALRAP